MTTDCQNETGQTQALAVKSSSVCGTPVRGELRGKGATGGQARNGKQPDGSVWADGMCISPASDSDSGRELIAYYNRPGLNTGD
jgi:hypothetical protein